jgi:ankyrin repeat protein
LPEDHSLIELICDTDKTWLDDLYKKIIEPLFTSTPTSIDFDFNKKVQGRDIIHWLVICNRSNLLKRLLTDSPFREKALVAIQHFHSHLLHTAADYAHSESVAVLLNAGACANAQILSTDNTPLFYAAARGHTKIIAQLLTAKVSVDTPCVDDATALYIAAQNGHSLILAQLLSAGTKVDSMNEGEATPLIIAARYGQDEMVRKLLAAGASVNFEDENGQTSLYLAAKYGHHRTMIELLAAGAIVNSKQGRAPIYAAAKNGHHQAVALLLRAGAAIDTKYRNGPTALDVARKHGHSTVVELLEAHMADNEMRHHITP